MTGLAPVTIATVGAAGLVTVQDEGRWGLGDVGVPVAGAWHRGRHGQVGLLLAGRPDPTRPTLELLAGRLVITFAQDAAVAVVGPADLHVAGTTCPTDTCLAIAAGARLEVTHAGPGPVYVGITGWEPVRALGSCSTDTFSRLGPLPLVDGDVLTGRPDARAPIGGFLRPTSVAAGPLRALRATVASGPEWEEVRATHWTVTAVARSGIRLTGERSAGEWIDLPSNPLVPGAIQATPDGDLVIIGPDGGVTGGYPVVGVVASVDLDRLSLLRPGERLRFSECDSVAAATAWQEQEQARRRSWVHPDGLR